MAGPVAAAINEVKPNVVVLLAGRWEVVDREYRGTWTNILNPTYAAYVKQQLEAASNLVTATGARMVFLTAPCTNSGEQPDGAPWPEDNPARLTAYNKLVREVAAQHPQTDSVVDLNAAACPGGRYASHGGRRRDPAQRRRPLHHRRGRLPGAQAHAADRGRRTGAGVAQRRGGAVSRRVTPVWGSRSAGSCRCPRRPGFCGLTFGLESATTHCACSEGRRWPSSTMEISEMVVISEFHEPSSEFAWAANGRAARSSCSACFCELRRGGGRRAGARRAEVVGDGAVDVHAGLLRPGPGRSRCHRRSAPTTVPAATATTATTRPAPGRRARRTSTEPAFG